MKKVEKILDTVMRFLMAVAMGSPVVAGAWQVASNWIFKNPSTFTDEFLRYMLIVASMLGSAYCFYRDEHLSLDLLTDRAKGVWSVILQVVIELAILFFVCYVFIYGGWKLAANATNISSVLHIPMKYLYMSEPVCGIFIVVARILKYAQLLAAKKGEKA